MFRWFCALVVACPFVMFVSDVVHAQGQVELSIYTQVRTDSGVSDIVRAQEQVEPQKLMKEARRFAEQGQELILNFSTEQGVVGGVYVFYNNPRPFCYTYLIPGGGWVRQQKVGWQSKDGRQFARVLIGPYQALERYNGGTAVERAANGIAMAYEKSLGQPLTGVKLVPFESALQGTWKWTADAITRGDRQIPVQGKIIADLSPDGLADITITGTADDDGLARRIIATIKTTKNPQCYFSLLDASLKPMLKAMSGKKR